MNQNLKKYIVSSIITFVTTFAIAVVPIIDSLTLENVKTGALLALVFTGVRAGVKAVFEYIASLKA